MDRMGNLFCIFLYPVYPIILLFFWKAQLLNFLRITLIRFAH